VRNSKIDLTNSRDEIKRLHAYLVLKESGTNYRNAVGAFLGRVRLQPDSQLRFFDSLESGLSRPDEGL
jgi:hypothetical protein